MDKQKFTMIVRHGTKANVVAYSLISQDYQTITVDADTLAKDIKAEKYSVNNIDVDANGKIVSTNGALDKYTLVNNLTGKLEGVARAVILNRVEKENKLIGYTIFTQNASIAEVNVADAVLLANRKLISNGKIRHTQDGDIVSSISGNFPIRTIEISKAPKGEITIDLIFFGKVLSTDAEYCGAIVSCTSATEMSKLKDIISKSNAKVIGDIVKVGGQKVRQSLAIQRFSTNGIYGVFEISLLEKLITKKPKVLNKIGELTVSTIKYKDNEPDEATVKLSKEFKPLSKSSGSTKDIDLAVKNYAAKIIKQFSNIKVTT